MSLELFKPWLCHMMVIILTAFLLAPVVRNRLMVTLASFTAGLCLTGIMSRLDLYPGGWLEAQGYWAKVAALFRGRKYRHDTLWWTAVILSCWVMPLAIAWITTVLRQRTTRPRDGGDASAPRTSA